VKRRDPLTRRHLMSIWHANDKLVAGRSALTSRKGIERDFTMLLLAYRGFLRGAEVVNVRSDELWLETISKSDVESTAFPKEMLGVQMIFVFISSSKTNPQSQLDVSERSGDLIVIGPDVDPRLCPIAWLYRWGTHKDASSEFYFHSFNPNHDGSISRASFSESVKKMSARADLPDDIVHTGHSARAGGATDAIKRGVDLRLVKRHGRWRSDAVFLYIRDDYNASMAVSAALGSADSGSASVPASITTSAFHGGAGVSASDSLYASRSVQQPQTMLLSKAKQMTASAAAASATSTTEELRSSSTRNVDSFYGRTTL